MDGWSSGGVKYRAPLCLQWVQQQQKKIKVDPPCDCPKLPDQQVIIARQTDGDDVVRKGDPPLSADQGQVVLVCEEVVFWMDNFFRCLQLQVMVGLADREISILTE